MPHAFRRLEFFFVGNAETGTCKNKLLKIFKSVKIFKRQTCYYDTPFSNFPCSIVILLPNYFLHVQNNLINDKFIIFIPTVLEVFNSKVSGFALTAE